MISMKNNYVNHKTTIATDLRMMMAALKFPQTLNVWVITSSYSSSSKDYRSLCINSIKNDGEISNANVKILIQLRNKRI